MIEQKKLKQIPLRLVAEIEEVRIIQSQIAATLKLSLRQSDLNHAKAQPKVIAAYAKLQKQIEERP